MRMGVVGSRKFSNEDVVRVYIRRLPLDTVIVSGGAAGPDTWAVDEARKRGMPEPIVHHVDRTGLPPYPKGRAEFRKRAFARNQKIVDDSDALAAFWDGKSGGTKDSIKRAQAAKLPHVIFCEDHIHATDDLWIEPREGH